MGVFVIGFVLYATYQLLKFLYRIIFFKFSFGELKISNGKVLGMHYEASHSNGKTTTPEKNEVCFQTDIKETTIDSDDLYQRVRIGEGVKVQYQERYIKPRFWDGSWSLDGYRLISVTSQLKQEVSFNDKKPILNIIYEHQRSH
jgi:hypothetical protein